MTYELMVFGLAFLAVMAMGGAILTGLAARKKPLRNRLREQAQPSARPEDLERAPLLRALQKIGTAASPGGTSGRLREGLTSAGYHGNSAASIYIGAKTTLLVAGLAIVSALLMPTGMSMSLKVLLTLVGAAVLYFVPNIVVSARRAQRRAEVRSYLADAVDLLEVCVSSGMSLDMAWNVVTDEIRNVSPTLADEMALTNLEMHLGSSRAAAMRNFSQRVGVDEIGSLVAVLVQSERFGTSMADALRTFAASMREGRSLRAQESAERMAVRLIFPMVLFIFPAVLIVLAGPAGITLAKVIAGK